jgi:hypothetical protein
VVRPARLVHVRGERSETRGYGLIGAPCKTRTCDLLVRSLRFADQKDLALTRPIWDALLSITPADRGCIENTEFKSEESTSKAFWFPFSLP